MLQRLATRLQGHARHHTLDEQAVLADVLEPLQGHRHRHDLVLAHVEAVGLQQRAVLLRAQGLTGQGPLRLIGSQIVVLTQEAQGLHHPAPVELQRLRRLRSLEEGSVEGEGTALSQAAVHLLHHGRLLLHQVDGVAEEHRVHRPAHELGEPLGAPLGEADDGAADVLQIAPRRLYGRLRGLHRDNLCASPTGRRARLAGHLGHQQPGDRPGARSQVHHALAGPQAGQGHQPPVDLLIERVLGELLQREAVCHGDLPHDFLRAL